MNGSGARRGRPPKGNLSSYRLASGHRAWRARVTAYGETHRFKLGEEPTLNEREARVRLDHIADQIAAGLWVPPDRAPASPPPEAIAEPTIQQLCEEYVANLATKGVDDDTIADRVTWRIERHLLPELSNLRPSNLTPARLQAYRDGKVAERRRLEQLRAAGITHAPDGTLLPKGLGPSSVNKMLSTLFSVLDRGAVFHDTQDTKRLRLADLFLPEDSAPRDALEPEQMLCVLDAAKVRDSKGRYAALGREAFVATLGLAGLRITEACDLNVNDYRNGKLYVREDDDEENGHARTVKTKNAYREVDVIPALAERLDPYVSVRLAAGAGADDPLFATANGTRRDKDNARQRITDPVVADARKLAAERALPKLPKPMKPHGFRRTFATHRTIVTKDPTYVAEQLGHGSARVTLDVYDRYKGNRRTPSALRLALWGDEHDLGQVAA